MLSSDYLFTIADSISEMYEELNTSIINDMARRIVKMDYVSETTIWQAQRAMESGALYDDMVKKISEQTGKTEEELRKIFKEAGINNLTNNLKRAGMPIESLSISENNANILLSGLNKTGGVLKNLTLTTAIDTQNQFIHATDLAYSQLISGAFDYNTVIRRTIKKLAAQGICTVDYKTGYRQKIDSAVRSVVLTGVNQTTGPMTEMQRLEVGADGYETTVHGGARQEHQIWQGKQFYADIPVKGYEDFKTATGYGTVTGLKGANCRHDFFWVFLGKDKPSYTKSQLASLNDKTVEYNGKRMTVYDAQTKMREIERNVRDWKRQSNALKAAGLDNSFEKYKIAEWTNRYKDFTNKTGLRKQNERLVVYDKIKMTKDDKNDIISFKPAKTKDEAMRYAFEELGIAAHYYDFSLAIANMANEEIYKIKQDFPNLELFEVTRFPRKGFSNKIAGAYIPSSKTLMLRNLSVTKLAENAKKQYDSNFWSTPSSKHTIRHELGHAISNKLILENSPKIAEIEAIMNKASISPEKNLSVYGFFNIKEFISECVAEYYNGNPRETAKEVIEILRK